jgi:hypothetical protein
MIRLRDNKGREIKSHVPINFIEICDLDGQVAYAIYYDKDKMIHVTTAYSKEAENYAKVFNVKFTAVIDVPKEFKD